MVEFILKNGSFIFLAAMTPWLFFGGPGYESSRLLKEAWNFGHVLFFGVFAGILISRVSGRGRRMAAVYGWTMVLVAATAVGIEVCQSFLPEREASWQDILMGVGGGTLTVLWRDARLRSGNGRALRGVAFLVVCILCAVPFQLVVIDEYRAWRDFPILSDFETRLELSRWEARTRLTRVSEPVKKGRFALRVELDTKQYSGISLTHFPGNWRGARALSFSVYNPGSPVVLHLRVHDSHHTGVRQRYGDRYNASRYLAEGWNTFNVPIREIENGPNERSLDLERVIGLGLFLVGQPVDRVLYLDEVELLFGQ